MNLKICPKCGTRVHPRRYECECGHVFYTRYGPAPAAAAVSGQFDCIALGDGRLQLCMPDGTQLMLTAEQRLIIAIELRASTC